MRIVHIQWLDSQSSNGWTESTEVITELELTHTVGILVDETLGFTVVAHSFDPQTDSYNGLITIPKVCIQKMRTLCKLPTSRQK